MLCLDKEKAIALAFSRPCSLFVFIFIYPEKLCCVLLLSNALHTRSAPDIKTWELPRTNTVWCQSAAPSEQSAVKHLAQGHLNRSCWRSKEACLIRFPHPDFPRSSGHEFAFRFFLPRGRCSTNFPVPIFLLFFLYSHFKSILWCP